MRDASGSEFAVLFIIETRFGITGTGVWHRNGKMHENAKNGNVKETYRTYCGKQTSLVTHNTDLILKKKKSKNQNQKSPAPNPFQSLVLEGLPYIISPKRTSQIKSWKTYHIVSDPSTSSALLCAADGAPLSRRRDRSKNRRLPRRVSKCSGISDGS